MNKTKSEKKKKKKEKIEYETVERTRNVSKNFQDELTFKQTFTLFSAPSEEVASKGKKILSIFENKEAIKKRLAESKNKLEALIY